MTRKFIFSANLYKLNIGKVVNITDGKGFRSLINRNREKYCHALENIGVYGACEENLGELIGLMEPFLSELNKNHFTFYDYPTNPNWRSANNHPAGDYSKAYVYNFLEGAGLTDEGHLTQEGYDIITFYRKEKRLPSREEQRKINLQIILNHANSLDWENTSKPK